jgi:flavin reductase (DIM6/NTAB) family NADH-FMN oxidoreductase RutF
MRPQSVDARAFRDTMGTFVTGVTVVTTAMAEETYGMTVNSFTALSLDPLRVLVCLTRGSRGRVLIRRSGAFSVNVLGSHQAHLSRYFADRDRPAGADAFRGVPVRPGRTGCPVLLGAAGHLDCRVHEILAGGDHIIVVGDVVAVGSDPEVEPLLFHRGHYRLLGSQATASRKEQLSAADVSERVSALRLRALPGVPQ